MLENLKKEVIRVSLEAQEKGLCMPKSGNFSAKDKETGYVVVTPAAIDRKELTVDKMSVVDENLNLIEGLKPSSETMMHIEIYKANPNVFGIAHTHSKMGTSFSVLNKPIPAVIYEVAAFRLFEGTIPVAPYARPGTPELALKVAEETKKSDLLLMEKHGVIAMGQNLSDAFLSVQYIEELAIIYYNILVINGGKEPDYFSKEDLESWRYPKEIKGV